MSSRRLLSFAVVPVTLGAFFFGAASLVSIFVPPFTFYGFYGLPSLPIALVNFVVFAYGISWMVYLSFAQDEREFPFLPYEPQRVLKVTSAFLNMLLDVPLYFFLFLEYVYLKLFVLGKDTSKYVVKENIRYGSNVTTTNCLDVYMPGTATKPKIPIETTRRPVIVFIYGGAWSNGEKSMYMLFALRLTQQGYVVVVPNYTLYPKTKIEGMVSDVKRAIFWTKKNISDFGGDPDKIYAMGHSAGSHILALLTVRDAIHKSRNNEGKADPTLPNIDPDWTLPKIAGLILASGVYDIPKHYEWETAHGTEEFSAMERVMGKSKESFFRSSPALLIRKLVKSDEIDVRQLKNIMPPKVLIMHGDQDVMVPAQGSAEFALDLKGLSIEHLRTKIYPGMGHSEPATAIMRMSKFSAEMLADISDLIAL